MSDECALVLEQKADYDITFMCDLLGISRSTLYESTTRAMWVTARHRDDITAAVTTVFHTHKRRCGARRIAQELRRSRTGGPVIVKLAVVMDTLAESGKPRDAATAVNGGHCSSRARSPRAPVHSSR